MGAIGIGSPQSRGRAIYGEAAEANGRPYVAACDVDAPPPRPMPWTMMKKDGFTDAKGYKDFRELLDDKDINAVTIATPDHWHALVAIDAMRKGKDVYCEKPLTLTIAEGSALVKVAKETGRIFQTGSQQRSDARFRLACELVRNGRIGKVKTGRDAASAATRQAARSRRRPCRKGSNWDFWLGPTPQVDYVEAAALPLRVPLVVRILRRQDDRLGRPPPRHRPVGPGHGRQRPGRRRGEWGTSTNGPTATTATPISWCVHTTPTATATRFAPAAGENGIRFVGEDGGGSSSVAAPSPPATRSCSRSRCREGRDAAVLSNNHMRNFLDGLQTRKPTICAAEVGFRSVTVCHIGAIAHADWQEAQVGPVAEAAVRRRGSQQDAQPADAAPWKLEA